MVALVIYQAAAEYVGTLLKSIPTALGSGISSVSDFVTDHPVFALASLLGVLMLWVFFSGGGRRG